LSQIGFAAEPGIKIAATDPAIIIVKLNVSACAGDETTQGCVWLRAASRDYPRDRPLFTIDSTYFTSHFLLGGRKKKGKEGGKKRKRKKKGGGKRRKSAAPPHLRRADRGKRGDGGSLPFRQRT